MTDLKHLVSRFRNAIDVAKKEGIFQADGVFHKFPRGCCGDTCELLAQYLQENRICSWYVCGTHYPEGGTDEENWEGIQSHAWLTTNDPTNTNDYVIIDITGDQFKNDPEYYFFDNPHFVGAMNPFHQLFQVEDRDVHKNRGLNSLGNKTNLRLWKLYKDITERL